MINKKSTNLKEHLRCARNAMDSQQFDVALKSISNALLLDTSNQDAMDLALELGEREEKSRLDMIENTQQPAPCNIVTPLTDEHLIKAHTYFLERQLDLALAEVAMALLVNPFDEQVQKLEKDIREAVAHKGKRTQLEPDPSTNSVLLVAKRYIERNKLDAAFEEVTTGLQIDPDNPELLWLRNSIIEQRDLRRPGEQHTQRNMLVLKIRELFARTEFEQAREGIKSALEQFPEDKEIVALSGEIESANMRWQELKHFERHTASVNEHIRNARQLLRFDRVDDAASAIALGLVLAPYNPELKKLEKELWDIQSRIEGSKFREEAERTKAQQSVKHRLHLLAAEEFAKHAQFSRALDEIAQAYVIDPLDGETRQLETQVRNMQQRTTASPLKLVYKNQQTAQNR